VSAGEALAPEIELTLPMELLDLVQVKLDTDLEDNEEDAVLLAVSTFTFVKLCAVD